ncbi:GNAT family N-acetyltransferase, partial [Nocardioides sp. NPDC000441]
MPAPLQLPPRYTERPLTLADAAAVTRVMAANELATVGEVLIEEADIVAEWQRPSFDVGAATVGVFGHDGDLVGYAECSGGARADAA